MYAALFTAFGEERANAFWQWFTTDWRGWGREGWQRLDAARAQPPCN